MGKARRILAIGAGFLGFLFICGMGWVNHSASSRLNQHFQVHEVNLQVPMPLSDAEVEALRAERIAAQPPAPDGSAPTDPLAGLDLQSIALERAVARGQHLVEARYSCIACHGQDFGGGVMVEDPAIGSLHGPNITSKGATASYSVSDWDHIVRHGIKPDGSPAVMPSEDFVLMSDRELSDIIAYVRSLPPVDRPSVPIHFGPLGSVLLATGGWPLSAERIADHQAPHPVEAPPAEVSAVFGEHLSHICTGCHGADLSGGPIKGAPPGWPAAANLTPHADGLAGWTLADFEGTMRTGKNPKGQELRPPMAEMTRYAQKMTDTELEALWLYLSGLPARASAAD